MTLYDWGRGRGNSKGFQEERDSRNRGGVGVERGWVEAGANIFDKDPEGLYGIAGFRIGV